MKKLIDYISSELKISNKALLEKDIILHNILCILEEDDFFRKNFVFKGGTCLTKCYLGYYRFSEDLDFTWIDQKIFDGKTQKEIRKILSLEINKTTSILEKIAQKLYLDFKPDKTNKKYIEIGGSNKFITFKLWYKSAMLDTTQFVKIQINFMELLQHKFQLINAKSLMEQLNSTELSFLFPEEAINLIKSPKVNCYSIKEILIEKFRAILTRRTIKARDFIDIFMICDTENINPMVFRNEIINKTKYILRYDKYIQNLKNFDIEKQIWGEEEKLLLKELPKGYPKFLKEIQIFCKSLSDELLY